MFVEQGSGYLVMELIPGQNLDDLQRALGGPLPENQVLGFALQLCDVVSYLHHQNPPIIHRDIKPANVRLTPNGLIKLVDFGLFKQGIDTTRSSRMGLTPAYAPAEQHPLAPGHTDKRSDIFSLGATLYHLLTGVLPISAFIRIQASTDPLPLLDRLNPQLSPHIVTAIAKAMSVKPEDRYSEVEAFRQALTGQQLAHKAPFLSSNHIIPLVRLLGLGIGVTLLVIIGLAFKGGNEEPTVPTLQPTIEMSVSTTVAMSTKVPPTAGAATPSTVFLEPTPFSTAETPTTALSPGASPFLAVPMIGPDNATSMAEIHRISIQIEGSVNEIVFSPNGHLIAVASDIGIHLYNPQTLADEGYISIGDSVRSVAFAPDSQLITAGLGGWNNFIKLWQVNDGMLLHTLEGHTQVVQSVAFSPDGQTLASGSSDGTIKLWRVNDGALLRTIEGHFTMVYSVAFAPDGQTLASGSLDKTVKLWRVRDGALLHTFEGHTDTVNSVTFTPDGQILASASGDKTVKLWQVSDGTLLRTLKRHTDWATSVAFTPDGQILASGSGDATIKLWRVSDGTLLRTLEGHTGWVSSIAFAPNGQTLASLASDKTVRLWGIE